MKVRSALLVGLIAAIGFVASLFATSASFQLLLVSGPGMTVSPITFYWGAEASPFSNAQYSVGSATGTVTGSYVQDGTFFKVGTHSGVPSSAGGYVSFSRSSNLDLNEGSLCGWFYLASLDDYRCLFQMLDNASGGIYVIAMGGGQIRWIYTAGGSGFDQTTASGTPISSGGWNWFEMHWSKSTNTYSLKVYNAADTLLISDTSGASTGTWGTVTSFEIGDVFSAHSFTYADNYIISNSSTTDMHAIRNNASFP